MVAQRVVTRGGVAAMALARRWQQRMRRGAVRVSHLRVGEPWRARTSKGDEAQEGRGPWGLPATAGGAGRATETE